VTTNSVQRQSDAVYFQLRDDIIEWRLNPGEVLSEIELSERFSVSRTPLREALQRLSHEGLVTTQHGRGATVSELSLPDLIDLVQWRQAIEPYAVRLCALAEERHNFFELEKDLETSEELLNSEHFDDSFSSYFSLIARFDDAIAYGCGNRHLTSSLLELRGHLYRIRRFARRSPDRLRETTAEHLEICRAICARDDRRAVEATARHIENSFQNMLESVRGELISVESVVASVAPPVRAGGRHD